MAATQVYVQAQVYDRDDYWFYTVEISHVGGDRWVSPPVIIPGVTTQVDANLFVQGEVTALVQSLNGPQ